LLSSPKSEDDDDFFVLSYIKIINPPNKTIYAIGDIFDTTGMKVIAVFNDKYIIEINDYDYTLKGEALTEDDTLITLSYTFTDITKICE
jgi:hypothetical protein